MSECIEFTLPFGYVLDDKTYRNGKMHLATTGDELENGKREVNLDENCFEIYVKVPERKTNKKVNVYGYTSE